MLRGQRDGGNHCDKKMTKEINQFLQRTLAHSPPHTPCPSALCPLPSPSGSLLPVVVFLSSSPAFPLFTWCTSSSLDRCGACSFQPVSSSSSCRLSLPRPEVLLLRPGQVPFLQALRLSVNDRFYLLPLAYSLASLWFPTRCFSTASHLTNSSSSFECVRV